MVKGEKIMLYYVKVDFHMTKICQMHMKSFSGTDYGFVQAKDEDRVREIVEEYYQNMSGVENFDIYVHIADKDSIGEVTRFVFVDNNN